MSKKQMRKETENSETYLKSVLKNSDGFTTPKNYFSEFDDSLELKVFEETLPKKTGFSVPKDYIENIDTKVLDRLSPKTAKKGRVIQLKKLQPWISIAAVFVISLSVSIFYLSSKTETVTFDDIAQSDIEYWMNNNSDFMTTIELETVLKEENIEETNFDFTEISSDDLEDYLLNENDIDIYTEI
jgi:hypothetical protein